MHGVLFVQLTNNRLLSVNRHAIQLFNYSPLNVLFCLAMGSCCSKSLLNRRREGYDEDILVDLRQDPLPYPVQCTDSGEDLPGELDFVDLRLDVLPVQCTEPSIPIYHPTVTVSPRSMSVFRGVYPP